MRCNRLAATCVLICSLFSVSAAYSAEEEEARAILRRDCLSCHGTVKMSGLDLRSRSTMLEGGTRGVAVVPGNAEASLLYQAVLRDGDLRMPMGKDPLDAKEVAVLKEWINAGAPWSGGETTSSQVDWWAFQKPRRPDAPTVHDEGWVQNPIDAFILGKLEAKGLKPAPPADRRTLIRRLSFDLRGLPPTPDEVEEFVQDNSRHAYGKLVERFLKSPQYGERWGRYWLDVVRYADTGGFETDIYFPNAWRFRDYVVKSLNDDKPYNRFVQEQIAGDELWPDDLELRDGYKIPEEKVEHLEARVGTGLYTVGPVYHEAALNGGQLRYEWMVDAVNTTGEAFMGLTVSCARCHDHKFDPISQADYHRMMAVFAGSEIQNIPIVSKMSEFGFYSGYPSLLRVLNYQEAVQRIDQEARERLINEILTPFSPETVAAYRLESERRTAEQERLAAAAEKAIIEAGLKENAAGHTAELPYTPAEHDRRASLIHELGKAALGASLSLSSATVLGHSQMIYPTHMTSRGDWRPAGAEVKPGVPAVLPGGGELDLNEPSAGPFVPQRRKALAVWLTDPSHPLTARVMVNRIWQGHFGRGIVATPNNFGRQGDLPTHPDLLDWLADEFVRGGWSIKKMHKLMLLSNTYRMSSWFDKENAAIDPENHYFWRMNRRRLDAETMRDAVLSVSSTLNTKMGGRPVMPPLTEEEKLGMWAKGQWPESLDAEENNRRSVYLFVKRQFPYPMFKTFDTPDPAVSCGRRDVTTVAPQALTLLNGEFILRKAGEFARRLETMGDSPEAWVDTAWRLAFARPPGPDEMEQALRFLLQGNIAKPESRSEGNHSALTQFCLMVLNTNEFLYID